MRPAGKGALESLYFDYPQFAAPRVPELDGAAMRHPVLIVGAGPIGMTAALVLARYGIRSVLIDRKDTFNDGSRAICVARPSMHILERIGAVAPFVEKALGWRFGRSYYRGEQIFRLEMPQPPGEKYLPMYNLQQQYIEQFLHDAVAASELVDMRWRSELSAIEPRDDGASVRISSPAGDYRLDADYMLAADGARSPIRSMLGLRLKGDNYEGRYVIADIRMDHDFPTERRAFFEPAGNPGGTVLIHKQPNNIWRVDYQLREGESEQDAIREDNIRARVGAILADIGHTRPWELEWWSVYSANTLCLDDYRHGRVIFIGDAAPYRADLRRTRAEQRPRRCRDYRLEAGAGTQWRSERAAARQLFAGAARRHARRVRQRHQEHTLHDPADARLAAGARGRTVAQPETRISARARQSPADAALYLFGKPADALCRTRRRIYRGSCLWQRRAERETRRRELPAGSRRQRHDGDPVQRGTAECRTGGAACRA
jgi:2-polyprenyl-6-methoxyphenol hydroxylase-like FAD-dependent oxidoreductase